MYQLYLTRNHTHTNTLSKHTYICCSYLADIRMSTFLFLFLFCN